MDAEEVRASAKKEERIIDTLEPVMNQHKLIIDPKVWEYDYSSILMHLLKNDWSICSDTKCRVCAEKRELLNTMTELMQSVKVFSTSSTRSLKVLTELRQMRKHEEWLAMMSAFENNPHLATDALVLGHSFKNLQTSRLQQGLGLGIN